MGLDDERALLGAILSGYRDIPKLSRIITGADFAQPVHEWIWNACLAVHDEGGVADAGTVRIKMAGQALKLPGGAAYLTDLTEEPIVPFQAPVYAKAVKDQSIRQRLGDLGARLQQLNEDPDQDPETLLAKARAWMDEQLSIGDTDLIDTTTALEEVIAVTEHGEPNSDPTPWAGLNELIGGWHPGRLYVVGARPGVGKSLALENAATEVARRPGKHVLFVSLEMSAKEITQRTLAHTARIPLGKIQGRIHPNDPDMDRIAYASSIITNTNIRFACNGHQTAAQIRGAAWDLRQAAKRNGEDLAMVVVDYLQLVTPRDDRARSSRQQQIGEITRSLKLLSKELEVPVLAAAQLNRQNQNRSSAIPLLSDLREAGDIEQDSDVVIFLHEEYVEDGGKRLPTGDVDLIVAKNRHGPMGTRSVKKYGYYAKLTEAAA